MMRNRQITYGGNRIAAAIIAGNSSLTRIPPRLTGIIKEELHHLRQAERNRQVHSPSTADHSLRSPLHRSDDAYGDGEEAARPQPRRRSPSAKGRRKSAPNIAVGPLRKKAKRAAGVPLLGRAGRHARAPVCRDGHTGYGALRILARRFRVICCAAGL